MPFQTKGASFDGKRAERLRRARGELTLVAAAAALELPLLRYALLEGGETTFVDDADWKRAEERLRAENLRADRPRP